MNAESRQSISTLLGWSWYHRWGKTNETLQEELRIEKAPPWYAAKDVVGWTLKGV